MIYILDKALTIEHKSPVMIMMADDATVNSNTVLNGLKSPETMKSSLKALKELYGKDIAFYISVDGNLPNNIIVNEEGIARTMTLLEEVDSGKKELAEGEFIKNNSLVSFNPSTQYVNDDGEVINYTRQDLIDKGSITLMGEVNKARNERTIQFKALDLYDKAVLVGDETQTPEQKEIRNKFRKEWLELPTTYKDLLTPIETLYPITPNFIKYYL